MRIDVGGAAVPRLSRRAIAAFARRVLHAAGGNIAELSLAFVDDATMRRLNYDVDGRKREVADVVRELLR